MLAIIIATVLTLLYAFLMQSLPVGSFDRWQVIAFFNCGLAMAVALAFRRVRVEAEGVGRRVAYALPLLVLAGTLGIAGIAPSEPVEFPYTVIDLFLLVLLIPVVEEVIFRRGLWVWLSQRFPKWWSLYLSALLFALAHSIPSSLTLPLGPFLLGLVASWSYQVTGRLWVAVLLHAACNLSAILLGTYARAWIEHFSWLYQRL